MQGAIASVISRTCVGLGNTQLSHLPHWATKIGGRAQSGHRSLPQSPAAKCLPVPLHVAFHLFAALERHIGYTHDKPIGFTDFVVPDEPLKVPGRIAATAARWRLGQPDVVALTEHQSIGHTVTDPEEPRLRMNVPGRMIHKR